MLVPRITEVPVGWSEESLHRFQEIARHYDEAFSEVERLLTLEADQDGQRPWVHSLGQQPLVILESQNPDLAQAEAQRRAWRVALHTAAELLAWHSSGKSGLPQNLSMAEIFDRTPNDEAMRRILDRFVTTLDYAKEGNCHYVDGQFLPGGSSTLSQDEAFEDEITGLYVDFKDS